LTISDVVDIRHLLCYAPALPRIRDSILKLTKSPDSHRGHRMLIAITAGEDRGKATEAQASYSISFYRAHAY